MNRPSGGGGLPSTTGLLAGGLVVIGVLLWMFVNKGLLVVAGIGVFGPGILREIGLLKDHDEFQRQAAYRAGYHAWLIGGFATVAILSLLQWNGSQAGISPDWIGLILAVLWLTWMFSALLRYWGPRRTTTVVLLTFGSFWLLFAIATVIGEAFARENPTDLVTTLTGIGASILIVGPFFAGAWAVRRWPRATGLVLIGIALLFILNFGPWGMDDWSTQLLTVTLLALPLLACGIALLREERP